MNDNKRVNLVLEGGGVKGIGLVGAITELEEQGYSWNYIGGTSAGAIIATLLAVGYTGKDLYDIISELNFTEIMDDESVRKDFLKLEKMVLRAINKKRFWAILFSLMPRLFLIVKLWKHLWQNEGLFDGEYVVEKVRELIKEKKNNARYTFADLARENDGNGSKLSLMVTDITNGRLLILPRDLDKLNSSPEQMEIAQAMRMSMGFPLFFKPRKVPLSEKDVLILMDGGILSNFPYWYIDGLAEASENPRPATVGILLDEGPRPGIMNLWGIIDALLYTMISPLDRVGHRALNNRIVKVRVDAQAEEKGTTREISTLDFDLPKADKEKLYKNGRAAAREQIPLFDLDEAEKPALEVMKAWSRRKGTAAEAA